MTALLVPVQLDALVVRDAKQPWALTKLADPKPSKGDRRQQNLTPAPFQQLKTPRPAGAYLHWALPDALTRTITDPATGRPTFRAVPDRWLLIRLSGPVPRAVRTWLIPNVNASAPAVIDPLNGQPVPSPGAAPELPLTAAGPGDLSWAGYFDNVRDRLALYDPLTGVPPGPVAYLVCGWYTDPALDPARTGTVTDSALRLADLGWTYDPAQLPAGVGFPDSSVYFGTAVSIGWPRANWEGDGGRLGTETDRRPRAADIAAGVGETIAEAVAAVSTPDAAPALARLVEGMLTGALDHLDRPDGPARLDTDLHARRFGARPSAHQEEWIWQPEGNGRRVDGPTDAGFRKVRASQPRAWDALAPEIALSGAGRGFRHGGDGRFTETGDVACRIEGSTLAAFGTTKEPGRGAAVLPANPLGGLAAYGLPSAVPGLLTELACLDPGSAPDLSKATPREPSPVAAVRAAWWAAQDPSAPPGPPATARIEGVLPSPLAVTPPSVPWIPMHLEWSAAYLPSPRRAYDWDLLDLDYALPSSYAVPDPDPGHPLSGRILLSAPAATLATAGEDGADLLSGAFADLTAQLRKDPLGVVVRPIDGSAPPEEPPPGPRPAGFVAFRAGFMRLDRLRLVDGYGRFLDLLPGLDMRTGPGVAAPNHPELVALKPRFTAPARVLLRYAAASGDKADASGGVSPVCGFVAPSPLDGTLEFFDAEGGRLGRLRPDAVTGTAWEEDPGQPASYGARPSQQIPNAFLGGVADALLAADTAAAGRRGDHTALESLVRIMDVTRWSVDTTGRAGDEHLALLLASPVAVLRATLLLDVQDPRDPEENRRTAVAVKLGTLAHQQDGLLAYTVADDLSRIRIVDPAVADGISSSFVDTSDVFYAYPGTPVPLLLFVVPQADVHVTTGLLPQKAVGMLREWTATPLAKLSPALRYGPVLRDSKVTRMPVPADIRGTWTWHRRPSPDTWADAEVVPSTVDAILGDDPQVAGDGWLSVALIPDTTYTQTAVQVRISHIRTRGKDHLIAVGGHNPDGTPFLLPVQQAARFAESGRFAFYVQQPGFDRREVYVVHREGERYLRTTPDPHLENNLMHLPEAPKDW